MSRWFRLYDRLLDDPKAQRLPPDVFKGWINLLCLASRNAGKLPGIPDIAFALRITDREADSLLQALHAAGLLEDAGESMAPHKWDQLQYRSDMDPTAAERKRRQRERAQTPADDVTRDSHEKSRVQSRAEAEQSRADCLPEKIVFPKDGPIGHHSTWGTIARSHARGADVDMVASRFRKYCIAQGIPFDAERITKVFTTFCRKERAPT